MRTILAAVKRRGGASCSTESAGSRCWKPWRDLGASWRQVPSGEADVSRGNAWNRRVQLLALVLALPASSVCQRQTDRPTEFEVGGKTRQPELRDLFRAVRNRAELSLVPLSDSAVGESTPPCPLSCRRGSRFLARQRSTPAIQSGINTGITLFPWRR
jgi:hypothetical protein